LPNTSVIDPPAEDRAYSLSKTAPNSPRSNGILGALSGSVLDQFSAKLRPVYLEFGDVIYQPNQPVDYAYFPTAGVISLLAAFEDGSTVEAGVIGSEGVLGTWIVLGAETTPHQALVQSPGHAFTLSVSDLRDLVHNDGQLLDTMLRYTNALFIQVAQTAACNRVHKLEQRLARWLLLTHDRVLGDEFRLTQDFISRMLAVRRAGVSVAANTLRQMRAIDYQRGNVIVLDRKGLENASCECYRVVRTEYDRLP
jgi:CRP-like cAMP-binding protein